MFAVTDTLALGGYHAAKTAARRIPADIALVGVGDSEHLDFFDPPLSCVGPSHDEVVAEIVGLLFDRMGGRRVKPVEMFIAPAVTLRGST